MIQETTLGYRLLVGNIVYPRTIGPALTLKTMALCNRISSHSNRF